MCGTGELSMADVKTKGFKALGWGDLTMIGSVLFVLGVILFMFEAIDSGLKSSLQYCYTNPFH